LVAGPLGHLVRPTPVLRDRRQDLGRRACGCPIAGTREGALVQSAARRTAVGGAGFAGEGAEDTANGSSHGSVLATARGWSSVVCGCSRGLDVSGATAARGVVVGCLLLGVVGLELVLGDLLVVDALALERVAGGGADVACSTASGVDTLAEGGVVGCCDGCGGREVAALLRSTARGGADVSCASTAGDDEGLASSVGHDVFVCLVVVVGGWM